MGLPDPSAGNADPARAIVHPEPHTSIEEMELVTNP
jgi:hypothetical protein